MSGNQYVYVVEVDERLRSNIQLVTKNRREAILAYLHRTDKFYAQGFTMMDHFEIHRGKMQQYVKPGSRNVCVRMVRFRKSDVDVVVRITAWVIKWAKDEMPRAAPILLDPLHGGEEKYPDQPPDGRVT